ncbi:MAG: hypothetical protein RSE62_22145 [Citrobacter sp.]
MTAFPIHCSWIRDCEIMEAREGRCETIIASQLEPNEWYLQIEGELMADSILNRNSKQRGRTATTHAGNHLDKPLLFPFDKPINILTSLDPCH